MIGLTPLPSRLKTAAYRRIFKFDIAPSAHLGLSVIACDNLSMMPHSRIGHMSVIRGKMALRMGEYSSIGQFNWISGGVDDGRYFIGRARSPELLLGDHSSITSRHYIDCTDRISIGRFTTIAGNRSIFITHGIDYRESCQDCAPIHIGDYCLIGSNVTVLKGVNIASRTILGAASVVPKSITTELGVWVGVPARHVKKLTGFEKYFRRQSGHIY